MKPERRASMVGFGSRIRQARESAGMSVQVLAGKVGTTRSWMSQIEHGHVDNPGIQIITKIADSLGVSIDSLMYMRANRFDNHGDRIDASDDDINIFAKTACITGEMECEAGRYQNALRALDAAIDLQPKLSQILHDIYHCRAKTWSAIGEYGAAVSDCNAAIGYNSQSIESRMTRYRAHLFMGDLKTAVLDLETAFTLKRRAGHV